MASQLQQRLIMSIFCVLLSGCAVYVSYIPYLKYLFVLVGVFATVCAVQEYYHLVQNKGFNPLTILGIGSTVAYFFAVFWSVQHPKLKIFPQLVLLTFLFLIFLAHFNRRENPLISLAVTLFAIAYLAIPLSFVIKINYFFPESSAQDGRLWLVYVLTVSKITDAGAYFVGKGLGANKLLPHISPKKTIEGAIGGTVIGIATSIVFYLLFSRNDSYSVMHMTFFQSILLGFILTLFAQFGDFAESILKRDAGVKDSSHLPGFGGVLDLVDSVVFTLPLMYLVLKANLLG